jgi:hypothetical protein
MGSASSGSVSAQDLIELRFEGSKTGISHSPERSRGHMCSVFRQYAPAVARLGALPNFESSQDFVLRTIEVNCAFPSVDRDHISILHDREWASVKGLRCDVSHNEAMRSAGESPVGDECNVLAQASPHHSTGW